MRRIADVLQHEIDARLVLGAVGGLVQLEVQADAAVDLREPLLIVHVLAERHVENAVLDLVRRHEVAAEGDVLLRNGIRKREAVQPRSRRLIEREREVVALLDGARLVVFEHAEVEHEPQALDALERRRQQVGTLVVPRCFRERPRCVLPGERPDGQRQLRGIERHVRRIGTRRGGRHFNVGPLDGRRLLGRRGRKRSLVALRRVRRRDINRLLAILGGNVDHRGIVHRAILGFRGLFRIAYRVGRIFRVRSLLRPDLDRLLRPFFGERGQRLRSCAVARDHQHECHEYGYEIARNSTLHESPLKECVCASVSCASTSDSHADVYFRERGDAIILIQSRV